VTRFRPSCNSCVNDANCVQYCVVFTGSSVVGVVVHWWCSTFALAPEPYSPGPQGLARWFIGGARLSPWRANRIHRVLRGWRGGLWVVLTDGHRMSVVSALWLTRARFALERQLREPRESRDCRGWAGAETCWKLTAGQWACWRQICKIGLFTRRNPLDVTAGKRPNPVESCRNAANSRFGRGTK